MLDKTAQAEALPATGFAYRPEIARTTAVPCVLVCLGDAPINHTKAQGAFGFVIARLDIRTTNKGEVVSTVGAKAFSQHRRRLHSLTRRAPIQLGLMGMEKNRGCN